MSLTLLIHYAFTSVQNPSAYDAAIFTSELSYLKKEDRNTLRKKIDHQCERATRIALERQSSESTQLRRSLRVKLFCDVALGALWNLGLLLWDGQNSSNVNRWASPKHATGSGVIFGIFLIHILQYRTRARNSEQRDQNEMQEILEVSRHMLDAIHSTRSFDDRTTPKEALAY